MDILRVRRAADLNFGVRGPFPGSGTSINGFGSSNYTGLVRRQLLVCHWALLYPTAHSRRSFVLRLSNDSADEDMQAPPHYSLESSGGPTDGHAVCAGDESRRAAVDEALLQLAADEALVATLAADALVANELQLLLELLELVVPQACGTSRAVGKTLSPSRRRAIIILICAVQNSMLLTDAVRQSALLTAHAHHLHLQPLLESLLQTHASFHPPKLTF